MTEAQVIALIDANIVTNHSQTITALVLNPILKAILEQPNDVTGELANLSTTDKDNLVDAINELNTAIGAITSQLTVHTGPDNPNAVPPASFSAPDIYKQVVGGDTVSVYMFNGVDWVQIVDQSATGTYITIGGNPFEWKPLPNNITGSVGIGDIALNGWWSQTEFVKIATFDGGLATDKNNWTVIESIG